MSQRTIFDVIRLAGGFGVNKRIDKRQAESPDVWRACDVHYKSEILSVRVKSHLQQST